MIPKGVLWSPRGDPNGIPRGEMGHSGAFLEAFRLMFAFGEGFSLIFVVVFSYFFEDVRDLLM